MADAPIDADALGATPISPDAPAGSDASYDPDYESLQREIDKLSMVSAAGTPPDWEAAIRLASGILSGKSKDLKVAAYLAEALTRTGGVPGLALGVHVLRAMTETFWDTLFPPKKRLRGRLNAIDWWRERAEDVLGGYDGPELPAEIVSGLTEDVAALDTFLAGQSDEAPNLGPMRAAIGRLPVVQAEAPPAPAPAPEQTPGQAPDQAPAAAPAAPAPSAATPPPPAPQAAPAPVQPAPQGQGPISVEVARQQMGTGLELLFGSADALLRSDLASPVPYRLVRLAAWLPLTVPPPAVAGKTMLPAPVPQIRAALEQTLASGNFPAAVTGAESHVREFRFWLDLSFISAEGLRNLGPGYDAARKALETETALLLDRFPGIENLSFSDGTPFACEKTKLWLSRLGRASAGTTGDAANPAGASDEVGAALDKARDLAAASKLIEAVTLLQGGLVAARSGRVRLRWRIGLVEMLLVSGNPETARSLIDQILSDVATYGLEEFDPELALSALTAARQGLVLAGDDAAKTQAREVLARIMRLDPAAGLRLSGLG